MTDDVQVSTDEGGVGGDEGALKQSSSHEVVVVEARTVVYCGSQFSPLPLPLSLIHFLFSSNFTPPFPFVGSVSSKREKREKPRNFNEKKKFNLFL